MRAVNSLPPTNRIIELEGVAIDRFEDGLILNSRLLLDMRRLSGTLLGAFRSGLQ